MYSRTLHTLIVSLLVSVMGLMAIPGVSPQRLLAQSGNLWRVDFYPNSNWSGVPVYTEYANVVNFNWGENAPGPNIPASDWTATFTSDVYFAPGTYRFTVVADDEFVLSVDGINYFNTIDLGQSGKAFVIDIGMTQGTHHVQVDYRQYGGPGFLSADWEYLKGNNSPTSSPNPTPTALPNPVPDTLITRYGDFTRCIQQNLHQSECFQSTGQWDSPNLGSIQMEPRIVLWGNCRADEVRRKQLQPNRDPQSAKCSKSEAGWFPT